MSDPTRFPARIACQDDVAGMARLCTEPGYPAITEAWRAKTMGWRSPHSVMPDISHSRARGWRRVVTQVPGTASLPGT